VISLFGPVLERQFQALKALIIFLCTVAHFGGFPKTVSCNRLVELGQSVALALTIFLKICCSASCTEISFVDTTSIRVRKNKWIKANRVFKGISKVEKSTNS
jgi:hypothetical protein